MADTVVGGGDAFRVDSSVLYRTTMVTMPAIAEMVRITKMEATVLDMMDRLGMVAGSSWSVLKVLLP